MLNKIIFTGLIAVSVANATDYKYNFSYKWNTTATTSHSSCWGGCNSWSWLTNLFHHSYQYTTSNHTSHHTSHHASSHHSAFCSSHYTSYCNCHIGSQVTVHEDATLTTNKKTYEQGEKIKVTFTNMSDGRKDWIAIYPKGSSNAWKNVIKWKSVKYKINGSVTFKNNNLDAGEYEVRAFFNNSYHLEASYSFTVKEAYNPQENIKKKQELGEALYSDTSLSKNGTMSCATCHHIDRAFTDIRVSPIGHMAAQSADEQFIADRNVPTNSYAAFIPDFHYDYAKKRYVGGNFLDGRAKDLKAQAKGPFLNPIEMQMPSEEAVVERVKENSYYKKMMKKIYGKRIFKDTSKAYDAIADAIANYEKTDVFSPFDSKYDRMLKGEYTFTEQEQEGLEIFSDPTRGKCADCHTLGKFTNYAYHNLGVPVNTLLREANGKGTGHIDHGLLENPAVSNEKYDGAFRVSSLRNIEQTAPYMHNGYFKTLEAVVHFYNTRDVAGAINPETGEEWEAAEISSTMNTKKVGNLGLSDEEEEALVAFMRTLSDARYELD